MTQNQFVFRATQNSEEIDFGRLFGVLIDHKWLIASITALFIIAGVIYAFLATPIYRADALVQVENAAPSNPLAEVNSLLGQEPPSQAEIEIIGSRMVLGRTVDILNLDLKVEPVRLPVIGEFLTRSGVERPDSAIDGFFQRIGIERPTFMTDWGYTWAGETISVATMPVTDDYLGATFTLEVLDNQSYALRYDGETLGMGSVGSTVEFLGGMSA